MLISEILNAQLHTQITTSQIIMAAIIDSPTSCVMVIELQNIQATPASVLHIMT